MKSTFVVPEDLQPPVRSATAPEPGRPIDPHNAICFGCGPEASNGLHLRATAGDGATASGEMTVESHFEGGPGVIHGGILSSAFDEMMGLTLELLGVMAVTAVLNVDYASPIQLGSRLRFDAQILGLQRRKVYTRATARIVGPDGVPGSEVAGAHAMFVTIDPAVHFRSSSGLSQLGPRSIAP